MHSLYKNKSSIKLIIQSIVIIFASLALSGCGTTSTVRDTSSVTQVDTVKKFQFLIDKKEWQKAYEFYCANDKALDNTEDGKKLADKLSSQIQHFWTMDIVGKLSNDIEEITKTLNPNDITQWPYIKTRLNKSNEVLADIKNHPLIGKRSPFTSWQEAIKLKNAHDLITKTFIGVLQKNFEQAKVDDVDFFNTYPLTISNDYIAEVSKEISPTIQARLSKSKNLDQSSGQLKAYENYLTIEDRSKLAAIWFKQYTKTKKLKSPLSPQQRITALKTFTNTPELWVSAIYIPIESTNQQWSSHLSSSLGSQNNQPVQINEIDRVAKNTGAENYDLVVFFSVSPAVGSSLIVKEDKSPAKYLVKSETVANPELDSLKKSLEHKQQSLSEIRQSNSTSAMLNSLNNTQDKDVAILTALSNGLGKYSESQAENDVKKARVALNSAPKTISKKVYADYQRRMITRKHIATMPIDILVYDTATKNYLSVNDSIKKEKEFSYVDAQSVKQSDSDIPPTLLLAKMWEMLSEELQQNDFKQYSLNHAQVVSHLSEKNSPVKLNQWIKQVEKHQTPNNQPLLTELAAASKPWSAETDSPLELYKKIKQRFQ